MSRWKAAGIHLSLSVLIGLAAAALIFGVWYPPPFSRAAGGEKLILVLLGVDLVIGPLLTLIVYRHGKKGMRFDLAVIALLQIGALLYGLNVVSHARPAFIVGAIDRFVIVSAEALDDKDLAEAKQPQYRHRSWTGPHVVSAIPPADSQAHNDLVFSGAGGKDIERFPKYYADYADNAPMLMQRARSLDAPPPGVNAATQIEQWLARSNYNREALRWLPLVGRGGDFTAIVQANDGRILDVLSIGPW